jgi:hypothetical protein
MKKYISCTKKQCCGSALVTRRTQSFDDQILKKIYSQKISFDQKLQFTYSQASIKEVQTTGDVFIPQKITSSISKL